MTDDYFHALTWPELVGTVHVCQGLPICELEGDAAVEAQINGCLWCKKIRIFDDGSEDVVEPFRG